MILSLIAEATEYEFKSAVEKDKPISWLKSVSAFANSIGGTLFFGVNDSGGIIGLENAQDDGEIISRRIKDRMTPLPDFILTPYSENGKDILALIVKAGRAAPYYYSVEGNNRAFVRIGSESVPAPDHILNELILKGSNRTFDSIISEFRKDDYSFTLLEATYLQRTQLRFDPTDYVSFGLATKDGFLTRAGALLTDQHIVYNSRMFCTRWNGLSKGSIFDDALDDKEYEGNLIHLLSSGLNFVKNNTKVRFAKDASERIDKPDYAERAVIEALVNALIHRDWIIMGSEVHIDIFDDRLEITSPGGMFSGKIIQEQDIEQLLSERRNPVIADLFHRMKYMERRGSGLRKIIMETQKISGYGDDYKPEFYSTASSFSVVLKNLNFRASEMITQDVGKGVGKDVGKDVGLSVTINETQEKIIACIEQNPTITAEEISTTIGLSRRRVESNISTLKKKEIISRGGGRRDGYWIVQK